MHMCARARACVCVPVMRSALSHNKIATLPILGTAAGGLSLTHLAIL